MTNGAMHLHRRWRMLSFALAAAVSAALAGGVASASAASSWWHLSSVSAPTNLVPGAKAQIAVTASNLGSADAKASAGHPIVIKDTVPVGLTVLPGSVKAYTGQARNPFLSLTCSEAGQVISCEAPARIAPYGGIEMVASVTVTATEPGSLETVVSVQGGEGGVASASRAFPLTVSPEPTLFGAERYELSPENEDGSADTQAGSHPFQLTTTFDLNEVLQENPKSKRQEGSSPALMRDLHFVLPPGFLGNVTVVPQCSGVDFATIGEGDVNFCPGNTAVGVARVTINEPNIFSGVVTETVPVFNLTPAPGEPARFGIELDKVPITLNTAVRTGSDYAVEVSVNNASQAVGVLSTELSFWGVPGDPRHDASRGWECVDDDVYAEDIHKPCTPLGEQSPKPFLTMPAECSTSAPSTTVTGDSWPSAGQGSTVSSLGPVAYQLPYTLTGCDLLGFAPTLSVEPDTHAASSPLGLTIKVAVPQESTLAQNGIAEADVKETKVLFPEGVQASPAAADGLLACGGAEVGFNSGEDAFPEELNTLAENDHFTAGASSCPEASKIGTATIRTPLLEHELTGSVYLASQDTDPFGSPLVIYLIAEDPISGVRVKLAGEVQIDQRTGALTSVFRNTPPVPFEELAIHLFGGPRASQSSPALCGSYTTASTFIPSSGQQSASPTSTFAVTEGAEDGACQLATPQTFAPSFAAGPTSTLAGGFTGFTLTINHADADQPIDGLAVKLPEGLAALISKVTPCAEPANVGENWSCGAESEIGEATTSSGLGSDPFNLTGKVYLTAGYDGAPFGLLVATLAKAGPFNLGWVYVRSRINVDSTTAAVTITTDEGPHKDTFPTRLKGVPVQLKRINVLVNRPEFQFNATNCTPTTIAGAIGGSQGGSEQVSAPYDPTSCASLPFAPKLSASTAGLASKKGGANLDVKLESTGLGQANIAKVDLQLPIALPSRQETFKYACAEAVFNANPAACGETAVIGQATIHTPVLKGALTGPAYLVSHGGAAFPDVEFVLQGEGIVLIVDGKTDITKGITYSRFESAPDAPFTTFETVLPAGPRSILAAYAPGSNHYDLCTANLSMPTEITAQDGALLKQNTIIKPTGCAKAHVLTRAQQLAKALKSCKKSKAKKKRVACERAARKKYGPKKAAKKAKKKG